jgi:outer membrane protein OmpA-like peptidoglycan-associated protein
MKQFCTFSLGILFCSSLFAQKDSAMAELTRMRETLSRYQPASSAESQYVTLKKTTYDSLMQLLNKQQQQIGQSHTEIELIHKKLSGLNSGLPDVAANPPVYFELGSTILTNEGAATIKHLVESNGNNKAYEVDGFTDGTGNKDDNFRLSQKRALVVKTYMVSNLKLKPENIVVNAYGSERKVCETMETSCNKQNRRVEIRVKK